MKPVFKRLQLACAAVLYLVSLIGTSAFAYAKLAVKVTPVAKPSKEWFDACNEFPTDIYALSVTDNGAEIAAMQYCAVNGQTNATIFADKSQRNYLLLERAEGRGRDVTTRNYLEVFQIESGLLYEVISIPLSPTSDREYPVYLFEAAHSAAGGLELVLRQRGETSSPCCALPEKSRIVRIDVPK